MPAGSQAWPWALECFTWLPAAISWVERAYLPSSTSCLLCAGWLGKSAMLRAVGLQGMGGTKQAPPAEPHKCRGPGASQEQEHEKAQKLPPNMLGHASSLRCYGGQQFLLALNEAFTRVSGVMDMQEATALLLVTASNKTCKLSFTCSVEVHF